MTVIVSSSLPALGLSEKLADSIATLSASDNVGALVSCTAGASIWMMLPAVLPWSQPDLEQP